MVNDEHIQAKKQERTRMGEQLTLRVRFTIQRQREPLAHLVPEHIRDTGGDKQQVHPKHSGRAIILLVLLKSMTREHQRNDEPKQEKKHNSTFHIVLTTQAYHTLARSAQATHY